MNGLVFLGPLGGGPRYEVVEAWDDRSGRRVAVKLLRPDRIEDVRSLEALRREASIASQLAHPGLVRFVRWSVEPPRPHLVFELVEAPTVEDHLEGSGPLSVPDVCLLGIRMLGALQYMHAIGVLHLDVKPANVTIGDPPRLLDLSLARAGARVRLDRPTGTPAYMAPEQCRAESVTPATDLFGLGATLYEALTAMQPFSEGDLNAADPEARYPQLVEEPLPLRDQLAGIPCLLDDVVMSCLARDPTGRPRATECAAALGEVIQGVGLGHLREAHA